MVPVLGYIDPGELGGMIIGFGLVVVLPIVGMMLGHQRRMAQLIHGDGKANAQLEARIVQLENEVAYMRATLADHVIRLDDYRSIGGKNGSPTLPPKFPTDEKV